MSTRHLGPLPFRSALAAGLVDELTLTVVPVVLGAGLPLFGDTGRRALTLASAREIGGGMVQLRYHPRTRVDFVQ